MAPAACCRRQGKSRRSSAATIHALQIPDAQRTADWSLESNKTPATTKGSVDKNQTYPAPPYAAPRQEPKRRTTSQRANNKRQIAASRLLHATSQPFKHSLTRPKTKCNYRSPSSTSISNPPFDGPKSNRLPGSCTPSIFHLNSRNFVSGPVSERWEG